MAKRVREESMSSEEEQSSTSLEGMLKYTHLDSDQPTDHNYPIVMQCSLPPHSQTLDFTTYAAYDIHYSASHVNRCVECHKNMPTAHFLNLHIAENHDPINEARRARGDKTYACFVEDCDKVCATPQKRRMHLVDKHMFPKAYDFFIVNDGLDKRRSLLRSNVPRRRVSAATASPDAQKLEPADPKSTSGGAGIADGAEQSGPVGGTDGAEESRRRATLPPGGQDDGVDNIIQSMSAMKFVPLSVRFGRGKGRAGFARS